MKNTIKINPKKLNYLIRLFQFTPESFLEEFNRGRKRIKLTKDLLDKILQSTEFNLKEDILKQIDKFFERGISYYTDFLTEKVVSKEKLEEELKDNVFFRKDKFNSNLNLASKKKVIYYNELKRRIITLTKNINFDLERKLKNSYSVNDNPRDVALDFRKKFVEIEKKLKEWGELRNPVLIGENKRIKKESKYQKQKEFLENLIRVIEDFNIFVFEFVERTNLKDENKINFNGLYLEPNIIVIKRNQKYFKREIFTLLHEFAHYILKKEEIDDETDSNLIEDTEKYKIEKWCNDFTFYFLDENDFKNKIKNCKIDSYKSKLEEFSRDSFLSIYSYYIKLEESGKISKEECKRKIKEFEENRIKKEEEDRRKNKEEEREKIIKKLEDSRVEPTEENIKKHAKGGFGIPKPIESNLYTKIAEINFSAGNIDETDLCGLLSLKEKDLKERGVLLE